MNFEDLDFQSRPTITSVAIAILSILLLICISLMRGDISGASSTSFYQVCCLILCVLLISYVTTVNEMVAWAIVGLSFLSLLSTCSTSSAVTVGMFQRMNK